MIKQIGTLNIEIERRKIKNINIYVKPPNGDVLVTVPMRVSNEEVFRFLKKKEEWIGKKGNEFYKEHVTGWETTDGSILN